MVFPLTRESLNIIWAARLTLCRRCFAHLHEWRSRRNYNYQMGVLIEVNICCNGAVHTFSVDYLWYPGASVSEHLMVPQVPEKRWIIIHIIHARWYNHLTETRIIHSRQDIIHWAIISRWKTCLFGRITVLLIVTLRLDPYCTCIFNVYVIPRLYEAFLFIKRDCLGLFYPHGVWNILCKKYVINVMFLHELIQTSSFNCCMNL